MNTVPYYSQKPTPTPELVHETYERITGFTWPGGGSQEIRALLKIFRINHEPGSVEANEWLQKALLSE